MESGHIVTQEVTLDRESLNQGDCFILDCGHKIYTWMGEESSDFEKNEATQDAERIESTREGHATVRREVDDHFWHELGGFGDIAPKSDGKDRPPEVTHGEGTLYKLTDTSGSLKTKKVAHGDLGPGMLDSNEVMMLDVETEVFLWIGKDASTGESRNAMATAMAYLKTNEKPMHTPIHLFKEGSTIHNAIWEKVFASGPARPSHAAPPSATETPAPTESEPALARVHTTSPAPTNAADAAAGIMSLEDLQDSKIWKAKGLHPDTREEHLADAEFQSLFGMDKASFAKQPKWKKDAEKKKLKLF